MKPRRLSESEGFTADMERLGDVARLDDVLNGLTWAIACNPSVFDAISGLDGTFRVATSTRIKMSAGDDYVIFNIVFREVGTEMVELLYLEKRPCENL